MANIRSAVNKLVPPASPPKTTDTTKMVVTPSPSKYIEFEKDSERWIVNEKETFYEFSLDLPKSYLEIYHHLLQQIYQTILELNNKVVIIKYKALTTINEHRVGIQANKALLNFCR